MSEVRITGFLKMHNERNPRSLMRDQRIQIEEKGIPHRGDSSQLVERNLQERAPNRSLRRRPIS